MIKHTYTESSKVNFSRLEERIMAINDPFLGKFNNVREMLYELTIENKSTLIMATGGSKVIAYYLQLIIERLGFTRIICEVIEPRDYFYKTNRDSFSNLIAISASGNTNGIEEVLTSFKGKNNSSSILLKEIRTYKCIDKMELTNSFITSEKEMKKYLNNNYRYVISFGQKPSTDEVFIELVANKNSDSLRTNFPYKKLEAILNTNKINFSISNNAGTYLCNNIYYEGLNYIKQNNLDTKMIFLHIPSINDSFDFNQLAHIMSEFVDSI